MNAGTQRFLGRTLLILTVAFLLLWSPLWNGYPFLHADSGTYIWSSVIFLVPQDRPIGYSLFLRATQLVPSLWAVVVVQALGTAYLMWRVAERMLARRISDRTRRARLAFAGAVLTIALTTLSTYVGFIIADILASWIFLATILFLVSNRPFDRVLAGLALWAGVWSHNSHVLLALGLALSLGIYFLLGRKTKTLEVSSNSFANNRKGLVLWFAALAIAITSMFGINLYLRAGAGLTRGGDTIWLNRFAESGVLQQTLALYCQDKGWAMCAFVEPLRAHQGERGWLLFAADSPVHQIGWNQGADEQREIVMTALACCWQQIITTSAQETWLQVWRLTIQGYVTPLASEMNAVQAVRKNFPNEWASFQNARQQTNQFTPTRLLPIDEGTVQLVSIVVALGLIVYAHVRHDKPILLFLGGTFYFILLNAAVMATFSGAITRYQGRVYWLLPFAVLVAIAALSPNLSKPILKE